MGCYCASFHSGQLRPDPAGGPFEKPHRTHLRVVFPKDGHLEH